MLLVPVVALLLAADWYIWNAPYRSNCRKLAQADYEQNAGFKKVA